nr:hypothetical protein [Planococcus salinarum]
MKEEERLFALTAKSLSLLSSIHYLKDKCILMAMEVELMNHKEHAASHKGKGYAENQLLQLFISIYIEKTLSYSHLRQVLDK